MADNTQRQREPRQPQPIKVAIETEEPAKIGDSWSILATAIVSQGNRTLDGREVQFFVDGVKYDQPTQTDDNGRAQIDIQGIDADAKRISVEAQIVGQAARVRKIVAPQKSSENMCKPTDLEVKAEGKNGVYQVNMQIVDVEGKGVPGKIRVMSEEETNDYTSEPDGSYFDKITISKSQEIHFLVLGTAVDKKLSLLGPHKPQPKCPITPIIITGFFSGLDAGWQARKAASEKKKEERNHEKIS